VSAIIFCVSLAAKVTLPAFAHLGYFAIPRCRIARNRSSAMAVDG
jgi:hypothetical protein